MWLVALPAQGDHAAPLLILNWWFTRLLVFCNESRGWFFSRRPPHILLFSWGVIWCEYLLVWKPFLVVLVSTSSVCLNFLEYISPCSVCLTFSGIVRIFFSCVLDWLKFALLVILKKNLAWSCRACFHCYFILSWIPCLYSIVAPILFLFLFVWFILISWNLTLVTQAFVSDLCFL